MPDSLGTRITSLGALLSGVGHCLVDASCSSYYDGVQTVRGGSHAMWTLAAVAILQR